MRLFTLLVLATALILALWPYTPDVFGFTSGSPTGYTGAPGENDCTGCHSTFALNSGAGQFSVNGGSNLVGLPSVSVQVSFPGSSNPTHGFQVTARDGAGSAAGTWTAGTGTFVSGSDHVNQNATGATMSSWSMTWTPPGTLPPGPVTFYAAGAQGDGGGSSGDYVYTTSARVYQAACSSPSTTWSINTTQVINVDAPGHGLENYVVAVSEAAITSSLAGSFGLETPLFYPSQLSPFGYDMPAVFQGFVGNLDALGQATAFVNVPNDPNLVGATLYFAFAAVETNGDAREVSDLLTVQIQ